MHGRRPGSVPTYGQELLELLRICVVAGVSVGILVIGLGSRLAMFVLRVTSPDYVVGMTSDDGFKIGQITLSGTYQLLTVGRHGRGDRSAGVRRGRAVADRARLVPAADGRADRWSTVGSLVIRARGIDFTFLEPTWLAVALFVGLPVVSGILLTLAVDLVAAPESWTGRGRTAWLLPVILLALVPRLPWSSRQSSSWWPCCCRCDGSSWRPCSARRLGRLAVRGAFLVIPVLSFMALGQDLAELY